MTGSGIDQAASALLGRPVRVVTRLTGGAHAVTTVVSDGSREYVVRRFPPADDAVAHEVGVLSRLGALGPLAPRLVAHDVSVPLIATDRLTGAAPAPDLAAVVIARGMAAALARIHELDGTGLRDAPAGPPAGAVGRGSQIVEQAQRDWPALDRSARVLSHSDFWCGNTLWVGERLTGVVDWSGARHAPWGWDVAWCRLDLVLLGSRAAADVLAGEYERQAGVRLGDLAAWDRHAAAQADPVVEEWADNYAGVGRPELTGAVIRDRLTAWSRALLAAVDT